MNRTTAFVLAVAAVLVTVLPAARSNKEATPDMVSSFGKYSGYSEALYDDAVRISEYLRLEDGTRLAFDLLLPTKKGVPADKPLPVLFKYTPYMRAFTIFNEAGQNQLLFFMDMPWYAKVMLRVRSWLSDHGNTMNALVSTEWLREMSKHGYAVIVVERPGTGASFGTATQSMESIASEANEVLNWIAAQPWCDGNIGMYGDSQQAWAQFAAASAGNPHLKAILPASSQLELYNSLMYRGGVYNEAFNAYFERVVPYLEDLVVPIDGDESGRLLAEARAERGGVVVGEEMSTASGRFPYRDSLLPDGRRMWELMALYPLLERINRSQIPVYMMTGWYDLFVGDMFLWFANLATPTRLTVRPVDHSSMEEKGEDLDFGAEAHRWFDYWLKGIDNGIMREPPIHYYAMGGREREAWRTTGQWPLAEQAWRTYFFGEAEERTVALGNDGALVSLASSTAGEASDAYAVDYTTTSGKRSRWSAVGEPHEYRDMQGNDSKALTYTTDPLAEDVDVTGHPVVHLWLEAAAPDIDVFVYLEDVDPTGCSTYITEGVLRASHRVEGDAPFANLGLPYHGHFERDLMLLEAGEPVELLFDLLPTSYVFRAGHRIRVAITCADAGNFATPILDPAPQIRVLRDRLHPSSIDIPVVPVPKSRSD